MPRHPEQVEHHKVWGSRRWKENKLVITYCPAGVCPAMGTKTGFLHATQHAEAEIEEHSKSGFSPYILQPVESKNRKAEHPQASCTRHHRATPLVAYVSFRLPIFSSFTTRNKITGTGLPILRIQAYSRPYFGISAFITPSGLFRNKPILPRPISTRY